MKKKLIVIIILFIISSVFVLLISRVTDYRKTLTDKFNRLTDYASPIIPPVESTGITYKVVIRFITIPFRYLSNHYLRRSSNRVF